MDTFLLNPNSLISEETNVGHSTNQTKLFKNNFLNLHHLNKIVVATGPWEAQKRWSCGNRDVRSKLLMFTYPHGGLWDTIIP